MIDPNDLFFDVFGVALLLQGGVFAFTPKATNRMLEGLGGFNLIPNASVGFTRLSGVASLMAGAVVLARGILGSPFEHFLDMLIGALD